MFSALTGCRRHSTISVDAVEKTRGEVSRDTECYPYITSIVSLSPALKVSALPRPGVVYMANKASLKVTCSPDTDAFARALTTE